MSEINQAGEKGQIGQICTFQFDIFLLDLLKGNNWPHVGGGADRGLEVPFVN